MKPRIESIKKTDRGIEVTIKADVEAIRKKMARYALTHAVPPSFRFK